MASHATLCRLRLALVCAQCITKLHLLILACSPVFFPTHYFLLSHLSLITGLHGGRFGPGEISQNVFLHIQCARSNYTRAAQWMCDVLTGTQYVWERVSSILSQLSTDAVMTMRDGPVLANSLMAAINFKKNALRRVADVGTQVSLCLTENNLLTPCIDIFNVLRTIFSLMMCYLIS